MSQADVIEELARVGWAIDPDPLTTLTESIEGWTTVVRPADPMACETGDTLAIMGEGKPEFIWCVGRCDERGKLPGVTVVRSWAAAPHHAGAHAAGTPIHRLYVDFRPLIGAWA